MKKGNYDFERRSRIDRRSGIDRRLSIDPAFISSGVDDRRSHFERRADVERRSEWFKINKFCSVYLAGAAELNISGSL